MEINGPIVIQIGVELLANEQDLAVAEEEDNYFIFYRFRIEQHRLYTFST